MDAPDFSQLEEVGADVAATQSAWGRYGDFMRERDEMANKDWLSMRDQVRGYWVLNTGKPGAQGLRC